MLIMRSFVPRRGILEDELKCEVYKDEFYTLEKRKSDFRFCGAENTAFPSTIKTLGEKFFEFLSKMTAFEMVYFEYEEFIKRCKRIK